MKRTAVVLLIIVSMLCICGFAEEARADQGAYGTVYAWADTANDCYVQGAVVNVYNNSGQYVTSTTASICGYYTVTLGPGIYHLVVNGTYTERTKNSCGNIVTTEHVAGDKWVTIISGFWNQEDINTL